MTRVLPIVPALMPILQEAFDAAEEGSEKIVMLSRYNLHRTLAEIIKRAGLTPWPDLFQALRRSYETELAMTHPQHAVSTWIGHSMRVSQRHYLQVPDELFDWATGSAAEIATIGLSIKSYRVANDQQPS